MERMILTVKTENRTGSQVIEVSLPRVDVLLDLSKYSLPPATPESAVQPPAPQRRHKWIGKKTASSTSRRAKSCD